MKKMPQICAFNKCSEVGVDVFAPAIFMNGCNFKCPYCMNSKLAKGCSGVYIDIEEIKQYVMQDKSKWFMISGGEPTCTDFELLTNLLEEIRSWGCKIGLSTNGSNPSVLGKVISLLQYVALDIKAVYDKDLREIGANGSVYILQSKIMIMENKSKRKDFNYEIRTTLYPEYIDEEAIHEIGSIIKKSDTWVLQQFRHAKNMLSQKAYDVEPYNEQDIKILTDIAKIYCDNVKVNHV